jgi:hypothetical protein
MSIIAIIKRNLRNRSIKHPETRLEWQVKGLISIVRHHLRAAKIRRMESDLYHERKRADAYFADQMSELARLKAAHDDRTSREVARDVERAAKALS